MSAPERFVFAEPVARALAAARPVVALETTVVTHGLPHPQGLEVARQLEAEVVGHGATPATIGVMGGEVHVGMTLEALERLAATPGVIKLNLSNFAAALAAGAAGSTTVAATMFAAHRAGLEVFATGGIGGVHREEAGVTGPGAEDVSSDLTALARIPVAVVCAGAKAILDLPRTVEAAGDARGAGVRAAHRPLPGVLAARLRLPIDRGFDSVEALGEAVRTALLARFGTGVLVVNPIPEADEMPREVYENALAGALAAATAEGVRGRAVTPFLLERMRLLTGGASLTANVALLRHNARVAARLAVTLAASRG